MIDTEARHEVGVGMRWLSVNNGLAIPPSGREERLEDFPPKKNYHENFTHYNHMPQIFNSSNIDHYFALPSNSRIAANNV